MTEARANEIFKTKYPAGRIGRPNSTSEGSRYFVVFEEGGRVYGYRCSSYAELLQRFGFKVAYQHDIESAEATIRQAEKDLQDGYEKVCLFPTVEGEAEWEKTVREKIADYREYLRQLREEYIIE